MKGKSYLVQQTGNSLLDQMQEIARSNNRYLPSDTTLASQLDVSRTTMRTVLEELTEKGLIKRDNTGRRVLRMPQKSDYYDIGNKPSSKEDVIRKYFLSLIDNGDLLPGDRFSELDLAKRSGCNTVTVREFLVKFSRFGLIEKEPRSQWQMVQFDTQFAEELMEFRRVLEMRAMIKLLNQDEDHPVWNELREIQSLHIAVKKDFDRRYKEIPDLDARLHMAIQKGANNRFFRQFFDVVSFVCHYHYQWHKEGEKERLRVAMNEHIKLLTAILALDIDGAISALKAHLDVAERTLMDCLEYQSESD